MFQEPPDDRDHANPLGNSGQAGAQAAHAADDQIHLDAGAAGPIQRLDDSGIGEPVGLENDPRRLAPLCGGDLLIDQRQQSRLQRKGCAEQMIQVFGQPHARQLLEELVDVVADFRVGTEQTIVGVQAGIAGVVVPGSQVYIAFEQAPLAAHHQHGLGVGLVPDDPIGDHRASFLQLTGQLQVFGFVEPCAQLDDHGDFLAGSRRVGEQIHQFEREPER